jgi:hypothetical protein
MLIRSASTDDIPRRKIVMSYGWKRIGWPYARKLNVVLSALTLWDVRLLDLRGFECA